MTPDQFRRLALSRPEVIESSHMGHPDFRANGRIIASLGSPDEGYGMVKLSADQQSMVCSSQPMVFEPAKGGWGRMGYTSVKLKAAKAVEVREAIALAVQNAMEKKPVRSKKRKA
ncbi:hypothetical protein Pan44_55730 [Caulifigura coniformis]|uniref:MmcQ/YjbR family DNA-binding protein n=1 Tax=Caulifigura coniformis TaxID=2527983 RepID=A0A517SN03_9PLAN|nr:MmcQ/YjbR family DNA-binding protein [Caulifigura coniformis]QDT57504.1 hypothetical protein Pan44_55730 [Caulifigura coniformis]